MRSVSVRFTALALATFSLAGCDALLASAEKELQGTAKPLKEADLPNTSKVLNCCANLSGRSETKGFVADSCTKMTPQVDIVIANYQKAKKAITDNTATTQEAKTKALSELKTTTQSTLEPASRCLLEETVGKVSLGGFLSPADCEVVTSTGALPQGKKCDDVKDAVMKATPN